MRAARLRLMAAALDIALQAQAQPKAASLATPITQPADLAFVFGRDVGRRLDVPLPEQAFHAARLAQALQAARVMLDRA
jgi:hypothetical protein